MSQSLAWVLHQARAQTLSLVEAVPAEAMRLQTGPAERHPAWVLGHLLLADAYLVHLLTTAPLTDDFPLLLERYGPASSPDSSGPCHAKDELIGRLRETGELRVRLVAAMTADELGAPLADAFLAQAQPTIGHHLQSLVFHEGYHAGQLSSWRRRHGFAPVRWTMGPRA